MTPTQQEAQSVADHLRAIIAVLEKNEPSEEFVKELLERSSAAAPSGDLSPTMEKWKRAAYKKIPKLLMGW